MSPLAFAGTGFENLGSILGSTSPQRLYKKEVVGHSAGKGPRTGAQLSGTQAGKPDLLGDEKGAGGRGRSVKAFLCSS